MPILRRTVKDSVFTALFREPRYARELYLALHPEDPAVTEDACRVVTLQTVLTNGQHNDLGLLVRDRLILLVEAQSTFSPNIVLRLLLYLAATYKEMVQERRLDLYGSRAVEIPRPELYVIDASRRPAVPPALRLSDLYGGVPGSVEVEVRTLRGGGDDIIGQYVRFCQIADRERERCRDTRTAAEETIRACLEQGILVPFLRSRRKEVQDMMVTLFDEDTIREIHDYNVRKEALEEGREEGREQGIRKGIVQGMEEGIERGLHATVAALRACAVGRAQVVRQVAEQYGMTPREAEDAVARHWT